MKKFLALVTLVCMVLTATAAFAFPSKTADDLILIDVGPTLDGTPIEADFAIFVTEPTEAIEEEIKAMAKHAETQPIATYYDEETQKALAELIANPEELVAYELAAVACDNYKDEYGSVFAKFTFATPFAEGADVYVALQTEGWAVQKCVVENGKVEVLFAQAELQYMDNTPALMVVMSTPIE